MINGELETRIRQTQRDVAKIQDVYEAIRPAPNPHPKPKENEDVAKLISLVHGTEMKTKVERPAPTDPFTQFQDALHHFVEIPVLRREQYSRRFLSSLVNHTRKTPAHVLSRLPACLRRLNQELDKALRCDLEQPSIAFRASLTVERAESVLEGMARHMEAIGGFHEIEPAIRERSEREVQKTPTKAQSEQFETIADFTPKQLCGLYRMRGQARAELMLARIREKMEEVVIPFVKERESETAEDIPMLKAAAIAYTMLSGDPRSYALITS
jgi:hypothetical protein